jgi:hypothetical protein
MFGQSRGDFMAELFRYAAFISYSSKDARFAQRLHRALESYGIPSSLGQFDLIGGGKKNRIYPVFRDREELSAGQLGDQIEANLRASAALIVVCSPNGAASPWVQKEIEFFAALGRHAKVFAIIPDTAPLTDESGADATQSCFPPAFRGDALAGDKLEPLAADARKGKDGFRNAWLKLVAGMIGVTPGQIIDRDRKLRQQRRSSLAAAAFGGLCVVALIGAAVDRYNARSDLTAHAMVVVNQTGSLDAAPLALAGLPAVGDVLPFYHRDAVTALDGAGVNALALEVERLGDGPEMDYLQGALTDMFSNDSRFLFLRTSEGVGELYDLRTLGAAPHRLEDRIGQFRFSSTGRYLLTTHSDVDGGRLYDLRDRSVPPRELQFIRGLDETSPFSKDDRYLIEKGAPDGSLLHDLESAGSSPRVLEHVFSHAFSEDGRRLVITDGYNDAWLYDLRSRSSPHSLGRIGGWTDPTFAFSSDGRFLVVANEDGTRLHDLSVSAAAQPIGLGELVWHVFSPDSRFLLTRQRQGGGLLRNLQNETVLRLDRLYDFAFTPNGERLLVRDASGIGRMLSLDDPAASPRPLGELGGYGIVSDAFIVTRPSNGEGLLQALDGSPRQPHRLGPLADFGWSNDGRYLLTFNPDHLAVVRDLHETNPAPVTLGRFRYYSFSADGRFLLTQGGSTAVRDLQLLGARNQSRPTRHEACRLSGLAVRPLARSLRAPSHSLHSHLQGRPWHPCDWRGILAIFPNAERGDGWFEGWRQWLRLMRVRHFRGRDWACEEATSAAPRGMLTRRAAMCSRLSAPAGG